MGIKLTMKLVKDINNENKNQKVSDKEAEEAVIKLLTWMGEDPNREGLIETPKRVINAYKEFFSGYKEDANKILEKTFGDVEGYDDMVIQKISRYKAIAAPHGSYYWDGSYCLHSKEREAGLSKLEDGDVLKKITNSRRLTLQIAKSL